MSATEARSPAQVLAEMGVSVDVEGFRRDGFGVVRGFASGEECDEMMERMRKLIEDWDPSELVVFRTDDKQEAAQARSDYFLKSGDKVRFFLEPWAVDDTTGGIKSDVAKETCLNKVGHGLHVADRVFRAYSRSRKVAALARTLGWVDPVLPQSMYIFKQPNDGAEVTSHQDSTFLHTEPRQTCLGLWLALQDATLTNGCIWARPGSHKEPLRRRFARNPEYFSQKTADDGEKSGDGQGPQQNVDAPQMIFRQLVDVASSPAPWEGRLPPGVPEDEAARAAGFVPCECKKGDLVLIHGLVDHMSLKNTSPQSRHTFQLHMIEGPSQGITWSSSNWLQLDDGEPFLQLAL